MDISVIITVYNGEKYIRQAINSIINQRSVSCEIIIINDGSTDRTQEFLEEYSKYENIIIRESNHIGRGKALNLGVEISSGKYISILDTDDMFYTNKLKIQHKILEENPKIGVLGTNSTLIGKDFGLDGVPEINETLYDFNPIDVTNQIGYKNPICHSSVLMHREAIEQVGGYDEMRTGQFDYDLWVRIAANGWKLSVVKHPLTYKRIHNEQNFEKGNRIKYLKSSMSVQKRAIKTLALPKKMYAICYMKFLYGLLPRKIRISIAKIRSS